MLGFLRIATNFNVIFNVDITGYQQYIVHGAHWPSTLASSLPSYTLSPAAWRVPLPPCPANGWPGQVHPSALNLPDILDPRAALALPWPVSWTHGPPWPNSGWSPPPGCPRPPPDMPTAPWAPTAHLPALLVLTLKSRPRAKSAVLRISTVLTRRCHRRTLWRASSRCPPRTCSVSRTTGNTTW